jgi:hypothetical protein
MSKYVLDHHLEGERARLALMSRLLDPAGWLAWSRDQGIDPHVGRAPQS